MFDTTLFLGFPLLELYLNELMRLPAVELALFIQKEPSPYLQQIENEGRGYLGKSIGSSVELGALEAFQSHIYSLLKKLVPIFPYEEYPLLLLALPAQNLSKCCLEV